MKPCYLDTNAGEPLSGPVAERIGAISRLTLANPNSPHEQGIRARRIVEEAHQFIARALGARPSQLHMTSGGSEANLWAIRHIVLDAVASGKRPTIVYGSTEHPSVLSGLEHFSSRGLCEAIPLEVTSSGQPDLEGLEHHARGADALFLMAANNETGVHHDLDAISRIVSDTNVHWHCDAVQRLGKEVLDFGSAHLRAVASLSVSAHKIGGPKGCGCVLVRPALSTGRPVVQNLATPNLLGIAGFATAMSTLAARLGKTAHQALLRDDLERDLLALFPGSSIHGRHAPRLCNTTLVSIRTDSGWIDGEDAVLSLAERGISVSTGAACSTRTGRPSHVLLAMGVDRSEASASLRISLGPITTATETKAFLDALRTMFANG